MTVFSDAYREAIEFTDIHCDNPELQSADDISAELNAIIDADCEDFQKANGALLSLAYERDGYGEKQAGHDFWLTRNRHGAGFWDRGLGVIGARLSAAAKVYGSVDLYVCDDNLIYSA
jgi:hypothetical protein